MIALRSAALCLLFALFAMPAAGSELDLVEDWKRTSGLAATWDEFLAVPTLAGPNTAPELERIAIAIEALERDGRMYANISHIAQFDALSLSKQIGDDDRTVMRRFCERAAGLLHELSAAVRSGHFEPTLSGQTGLYHHSERLWRLRCALQSRGVADPSLACDGARTLLELLQRWTVRTRSESIEWDTTAIVALGLVEFAASSGTLPSPEAATLRALVEQVQLAHMATLQPRFRSGQFTICRLAEEDAAGERPRAPTAQELHDDAMEKRALEAEWANAGGDPLEFPNLWPSDLVTEAAVAEEAPIETDFEEIDRRAVYELQTLDLAIRDSSSVASMRQALSQGSRWAGLHGLHFGGYANALLLQREFSLAAFALASCAGDPGRKHAGDGPVQDPLTGDPFEIVGSVDAGHFLILRSDPGSSATLRIPRRSYVVRSPRR